MHTDQDSSWIDFVPKRIGILVSDSTLTNMIEYGLKRKHYSVRVFPGDQKFLSSDLTLDVLIADLSRLSEIRLDAITFPIIIIHESSLKINLDELTIPGVSYLEKPFEFDQLLHAIQSVIHQNNAAKNELQVSQTHLAFRLHGIELYPTGMEIECSSQRLHLTWREYQVFVTLLEENGHMVTTQALLDILSERISNQRTSLTQCINKLRQKLRCCRDRIEIHTEINEGYRMQITI
ncbi:DNA-binding response OmpR family regulator [Paenibacillus taihuensis]|uniref:DNA-binding response OmpR family regulator n=1 Tax=Paenibacillus taihuensis TaxID=1156355 RepID=A0A3D9RUZ9_9BACL|nr:winged helix-turn-helix domain-containing protein [Paenibacillus taihuensis]REE81571.1 DNA-binding response OmpR family regulator [Paenibacillus taihuensis]